jgi:hypothetical protein
VPGPCRGAGVPSAPMMAWAASAVAGSEPCLPAGEPLTSATAGAPSAAARWPSAIGAAAGAASGTEEPAAAAAGNHFAAPLVTVEAGTEAAAKGAAVVGNGSAPAWPGTGSAAVTKAAPPSSAFSCDSSGSATFPCPGTAGAAASTFSKTASKGEPPLASGGCWRLAPLSGLCTWRFAGAKFARGCNGAAAVRRSGSCIMRRPGRQARSGGWRSGWTAVPRHPGSGWSARVPGHRSPCRCPGRWKCVRRRS